MAINNNIPFRFWCQKVLPLVYDNSLSYYEFLCKIAKILQEVMEHDIEQDENIEQNRRAIEAINTALESIRGDIEEIQRVNRLQQLAITANSEDINRLSDDIAVQYNESESYDIGDFAMLGKELYRKVRNTGVFADDWEKVNIADFVSTALEDIEGIKRVNILQELAISANADDINRLSDDFAGQYNSGESYNIGDFAMLAKELYRKVRNTGVFNDDWEKTTVAEIVSLVNSGLENIRGKLITLTNNFADEYAENTYYNVGQYCVYNDTLYKCVEAIPSPSGEFDPLKWTRTKESIELRELWDECGNIRLALDGLVVNFMGNLALPFSNYEGTTVTYTVGDLVTDHQWLYKCIQGYSFSQVVPTPANDRVHWQQTTIADNLSSGGGGGGSESVPAYDPSKTYSHYDFVSYNDVVYMCKSTTAGGTFNPNDWVAMDTFTLTSGNARILMTDYGEYYGDADKGLLVAYRDPTTNRYFLYRCTDDTSGAFDPDNFVATDLITELNMESYLTCNRRIDTYDSTATYNVGDIMIYGGMMYKCIVDGTTGNYDYHNWEDTNMFKELASVKNTLINLNLYNGNVVDRYNTNVTEVI